MTPAELSRAVLTTVRRAVDAAELAVEVPERVLVQRPPRPGCGDYATNVALQLAGPAGRTPREVAEILRRRLAREPGIAQVRIAGAGFLNITLSARAYGDVVRDVRAGGYGRGEGLADEQVTVAADEPTHEHADQPPGGAPTATPREPTGKAPHPGLHQSPHPSPRQNPQAFAQGTNHGALRARLTAEVVNVLLAAAGARPAAPGTPPERLTVAEPLPTDPGERDRALAALGPDAARWALLRPPAEDTPCLTGPAAEALLVQREANPLFRIRYAHARTRALLHNARDLGVDIFDTPDVTDGTDGTEAPRTIPYHPAETELLGLIADFPRVIESAARRRGPDRVARHLERLADAFFRFHDECPPLPKGDEKPSAVHAARIGLADVTGIVLADGLRLLGISAPDRI